MPSSQSICSILLAFGLLFHVAYGSGISAREDTRSIEVIGYRTVSSTEASMVSRYHRVSTGSYELTDRNQIGNGLYLVNKHPGWSTKENDDTWFCSISANSKAYKDATKVWIPRKAKSAASRRREVLWFQDEKVILNYITSKAPGSPGKAVRFSYIPNTFGDWQMVIPDELIESDELGLSMTCFDSKRKLKDYSIKPYQEWKGLGIIGGPNSKKWFSRWRSS
ncbi:uncharacterized protein L3040_001167 [Drepanopeziza brunnea f. sp. 'multigermtubi']|uniref:Uncharacterized protein n=1 Tax=Marssonina brunnea f. sp. multigermtubi (strain MB_m1) TaxID=1072389 RepID=K1XVX2_MARBU|nr:uncharacterized protein MBM_05353 [Drepanopeziza brunnea f. sp. 'multigermtubi' MB_m1]EKD16884.1 hypothetical protein MBM_05353 [Drepanopeziza brunnea f. sp. 'multigermtubi' MB_m1]KAJ5054905.1 hypothetical protein L3040_001167 [Drepanopeziza brunnea f. sp. 'multigermtubi']